MASIKKFDEEEILSVLKEIIYYKLGIEKELLDTKTNLSKDLGVDSLDLIEFILELESAFNISFRDEEKQDLKTLGTLVQTIKEKRDPYHLPFSDEV